MRPWTSTNFHGSVPRRAAHLTPPGHARKALDCRLEDGTVSSWRALRQVDTVAANTRSCYQAFDCCWLYSTCEASWCEGPTTSNHVFATGYNDKAYPVRIVPSPVDCSPTVYRLGLPCPIEPPAAVPAVSTPSKAATPRHYAYRWVDTFGNVSGISPVSDVLVVEDGVSVLLSGWAVPVSTAGWDIAKVEILRSASGYESATQLSENKIDAAWMKVATILPTAVSYTDTLREHELYEAAPPRVIEPPPAGLQGMVWLESLNALAGFVGRDLYFSHNNEYGNWPYRMTLDDTPKAIVESSNRIYVATDGHPYVLTAEGDCESAACRRAIRMPEALPMLGCCTRMVAMPSGALYPSHDGLVMMRGDQQPGYVTASHYAPADWQQLHPDTIKVAYHQGRLFCFGRNGAFVMALKDGASTLAETEHHSELSMRPDEVIITRTGRFYLRIGTGVFEWDRGATLLPHTYSSGALIAPVPVEFGAAQVVMDPGLEKLEVFADGLKVSDDTVHATEVVVLPRWAEGHEWHWRVSGTARVKIVSLASSPKGF